MSVKLFLYIVAFLFCMIVYFFPSLVANQSRHRARASITIINFFFGWTFIGWVICLAWAYSGNEERDDIQDDEDDDELESIKARLAEAEARLAARELESPTIHRGSVATSPSTQPPDSQN
jgi:type VI protein secretion system component VasK